MSHFDRPVLVMFTSIPGSGKSYFARQAAVRMGAIRLSSDAIRLAIFGSLDAYRQEADRLGKERVLEYVFGAMGYAGDQILGNKQDLIYDTNTNRRLLRDKTAERAHRSQAVPIIVHIEVPDEVAMRRGQEREELPDSRRKTAESMRELIDRIQAGTDPFGDDESVVNLDGMAPFEEQFADFESQVKEIVSRVG